MSYYDPFGRRYRPTQPQPRRNSYQQEASKRTGAGQQPTLEDYYRLVEVHKELEAQRAELTKKLQTTEEALRQQTKKAIDLNEELRAAKQEAEQLHAELETLSAQNQQADGEWQERYLRLQSEIENYRRRLEHRSAAEVNKQRYQVLEDMLSLADHLEMALQHLDRNRTDDATQLTEKGESFRQNLEATLHAFLETLRKHGVQPIEPMGQPFDPQIHEALGQIPHPDVPEDHVAAVVRTGYLVDDQLLRPARVLVSGGVQ